MRPPPLDDLAERGHPRLRHRTGASVASSSDDHALRAVGERLARGLLDAVPDHERDVLAAELARQLAALAEQLERRGGSARPARVSTMRPAVVRLRPAARRGAPACPRRTAASRARRAARGSSRRPRRPRSATSPARSGVTSRTASTRVGEPVWPKRLSFGRRSSTRSCAVQTSTPRRVLATRPSLGAGGGSMRATETSAGGATSYSSIAVVALAQREQSPVRDAQLDHARQLRDAEERGHLGRHLPGLGVERLAPAEDEVDAALLPDRAARASARCRACRRRRRRGRRGGSPRSAPSAMHSRSASAACGGPIVIATTSPPACSRRRTAAATACRSSSFSSSGTPSRLRLFVSWSNSIASPRGTCLTRQTIFTSRSLTGVDVREFAPVFTTRPELRGSFGMVASTHWLASASGMAVLEQGGNAFDAAVAAGLVLQVVEPHLNGPAGDLPALVWSADRGEPLVLCGQGVAPAAATIERVRGELGVELIPGNGFLPAVVPGRLRRLDARCCATSARSGSPTSSAFAIGYAEDGYPLPAGAVEEIHGLEPLFREAWPTSAELYLPGARGRSSASATRRWRRRSGGSSPRPRRPRATARTGSRRRGASGARGSSARRSSASRRRPRRSTRRGGGTGACSPATTSPAGARAGRSRSPLDYARPHGAEGGPVEPGAGLPPAAAPARRLRPRRARPGLARATSTPSSSARSSPSPTARPGTAIPPSPTCRSRRCCRREYADERRALVGGEAARRAAGPARPAAARPGSRGSRSAPSAPGLGDPTRGTGDTCHVDVADRFGNLVSATPSGGWLSGSPVVPELGFCLGTRGADVLARRGPPEQPRAGQAAADDALADARRCATASPYLALGTPGGDQQDQWSLHVFLAHAVFGLDLQAAIDAPDFHTEAFPSSFYPRGTRPRHLAVEAPARGRRRAARAAGTRSR